MPVHARTTRGFTLTELMIVMVLLGVLVAGVMNVFTIQKKSASTNRQVTDAQHTSRLVGDLLELDLRHTGFLVPESGAYCAIDTTNTPDVLYVTDSAAVDPAAEIRNDLGPRLTAGFNVAGDNLSGTGSRTFTLTSMMTEAAAPTASYDTDGNGVADSDFRVGSGVIFTDAGNPGRGSACGTITALNVGAGTITVTVESAVLGAMPASPDPVEIVAIPAHVYRINGNLQLLRDGQPVADDVEDLQIAAFVDADQDRAVDAGEYRGISAADMLDPSGTNISLTREVRANFVVRTRRADIDSANGRFQQAENRAAVAGTDGFRRRAYSATVMLRNVGTRVDLTP